MIMQAIGTALTIFYIFRATHGEPLSDALIYAAGMFAIAGSIEIALRKISVWFRGYFIPESSIDKATYTVLNEKVGRDSKLQ